MIKIKSLAHTGKFSIHSRYKQQTKSWVLNLFDLAAIAFTSGTLYSINAIRYAFPLGFGGLFALMSEVLASNHFRLPVDVPFYGPGSIPLAYPPFAIYLMAFTTQELHLSTFEYLRFAPVIFSMLALIPLYLFYRLITASRIQSFIAVLFITFSLEIYQMQATSGGVVRSVGFLFMNSSLLFTYLALSKRQGKLAALAASFLGLTVLTHLSYALFLCFSIGILFLVEFRSLRQFKYIALIFSGGLLITLPWLFVDISSYGFQVILSAFQSHGNLNWFWITYQAFKIPRFVVQIVLTIASAPLPGVLAVIGLALTLLHKKWFLPIWFITTSLFVTEGERFLVVIAAPLAGLCFYEIAWFASSLAHNINIRKILFSSIIGILMLLSFLKPLQTILSYRPVISNVTFELGNWFQAQTPSDARFLFLTPSEDAAEWLPYLLHRTPVVGHWGAEWVGTYEIQRNLLSQVENCVQEQSFDCVEGMIDKHELKPDYLITPGIPTDNLIVRSLSDAPGWTLGYENDAYQVWQRK